jgi:hypothetical protein
VTDVFIKKTLKGGAYPWWIDTSSDMQAYFSENPSESKRGETFDYIDPNIGWKIRINALGKDVKRVSEYLKDA